ncbi:MAG: hypothetical protein O7J95_16345 [Planctomycetota bacterium]|nr:hypothetical protein [Planctomycetota bacterium]
MAICLLAVAGFSRLAAQAPDCTFVRGDLNDSDGTGVVDLNDAVDILAFLYLGVAAPECVDAADVNDNGLVEPSDYTYLVNFLFSDGPAPPAPFPEPGTDPTPDVTVPAERDDRFSFAIGRGAGIPSFTGIELPLTVSNSVEFTAIQMVLRYNQADPDCPDLLVQEIRTEEGTLLSEQSSEYIIAEFDNANGIAFIAALKDFATPFWFHVMSDPSYPTGDNQLVGTLVVAVSACADMGFSPIGFADGLEIPNNNGTPPVDLPVADNLILLGGQAVRPVLGEDGGIDVRRGFIRGDANKDDGVDIGDPVFLLDYIFKGGTAPPCLDAADTNNDTRVDISDPIFLLSYLFLGGPQPSEPFPQAGVDPSDDGSGSLGCESDRIGTTE